MNKRILTLALLASVATGSALMASSSEELGGNDNSAPKKTMQLVLAEEQAPSDEEKAIVPTSAKPYAVGDFIGSAIRKHLSKEQLAKVNAAQKIIDPENKYNTLTAAIIAEGPTKVAPILQKLGIDPENIGLIIQASMHKQGGWKSTLASGSRMLANFLSRGKKKTMTGLCLSAPKNEDEEKAAPASTGPIIEKIVSDEEEKDQILAIEAAPVSTEKEEVVSEEANESPKGPQFPKVDVSQLPPPPVLPVQVKTTDKISVEAKKDPATGRNNLLEAIRQGTALNKVVAEKAEEKADVPAGFNTEMLAARRAAITDSSDEEKSDDGSWSS
ncbi:MAG: WH2 domain-containing protein [Alphaproteobacteria bacterium]